MPSSSSDEVLKNGREREPTASEEYLKKILSQESKSASIFCEETDDGARRNVSIESVEIEGNGVMIGENYGSSMVYAKVKYLDGEDLKEMGIETPWHVEIMNIFVLFEKEVEFFRTTLPAIERFQAKRGVSRQIKELLPRCLYAHTEKGRGIVITENICQQGFKMADRRRGLGLTHATLAMKALARFHAASLTMKILEPETFRKAFQATQREAYFTEERAAMFDKLYKQVDNIIELSNFNHTVRRGPNQA
ncbi:hypothetical protein J437_LFUL008577 [Ladona fulva]|uniref:Uncharacterized protein n=1 Tax=Ladona fulva TaxID=123851 RepID=A0A8K0K774_LADFU|nr:hypothetical protein J437_LFUL008577 [Ladona fulva]